MHGRPRALRDAALVGTEAFLAALLDQEVALELTRALLDARLPPTALEHAAYPTLQFARDGIQVHVPLLSPHKQLSSGGLHNLRRLPAPLALQGAP